MRKPKIAIVGIGLRLPGNLKTLDSYFKALENKEDLVKRVSDDRFTTHLFESSIENTKGHAATFCAGVIDNIYNFDYKAFNLSKNEVESMDVQQRLCLMMTIDALRNANLSPKDIASSDTAVFIGAASTDMAMSKADDLPVISSYGMTGTNLSIISNRLSYYFDLHGPSMTIDTACSSSLVALDQAVNYIAANPQSMAITGGVNILLSPLPFIGFSQAHMLSPDGRCKVFDDSANGYVRAEGGAVLILKTLEKAIADKDNIIATIVDSRVNQDGRTLGISLPSDKSQQNLLETLYEDKDLSRLVYVEAHGTGTLVGDPIEVGSIGRALGKKVSAAYNRPLYIGSAKSNVGHLETASGMAGLLKAIAILKNKKIPPSIHVNKLNSKIDFDSLGVKVVLDEINLPKVEGREIIGINSFGFGGTNAHVIIEAFDNEDAVTAGAENAEHEIESARRAPEKQGVSKADGSYVKSLNENVVFTDKEAAALSFFKITAASRSALDTLVREYKAIINAENYRKIIDTVYFTQSDYDLCLYLQADCFESLKEAIDEYLGSKDSSSGVFFELVTKLKGSGKSMFVFSGNGSQYVGMGLELIKSSALFKAILHDIDTCLLKYQDWSVIDYINSAKDRWNLNDTTVVQPIVFALEAALCRYLDMHGIRADGACGHSVGEVAAAYYCRALSLDEACHVIVSRSKAQGRTYDMGDMAVVKIDRSMLDNIMSSGGFDRVEIAAVNTNKSFTLSGDKEQLTGLVDTLKKDFGVGAKVLSLNYPFHSAFMDVIKDGLLADLNLGLSHELEYDFYTATKGLLKKGSRLDGEYWWHNIRNQVQFAKAIEQALEDGFVNFIEIGPRDILLHYVKDMASLSSKSINTLSFTARKGDKLVHELCSLLSSSMLKDTRALFDRDNIDRHLSLPLYPFEGIHVPPKISSENLGVFRYEYDELLGKKTPYEKDCYINEFDLKRNPYFNDHVVFKECVLPAAALINMSLTAAYDIKDSDILSLDDFVIRSSTRFNEHDIVQLKTRITGTDLVVSSKTYNESSDFEDIVKATVSKATAMKGFSGSFASLCSEIGTYDIDNFYKKAESLGILYKNSFRSVISIKRSDDTLYLTIDNKDKFNNNCLLNIYALDGILQSLFAFFEDSSSGQYDLMLPSLISKIRVNKKFKSSDTVNVIVKLVKFNRYNAVLDCTVLNDANECFMTLQGVRYIRFANRKSVLNGLFASTIKPLVSLVDNDITDDTARRAKACASKISLNDNILRSLETNEDKDSYLNLLICLEIFKQVQVFDSYADVKDIFGLSDDASVSSLNFAQYLCDFLCSCSLASKDEDANEYRVDRELAEGSADELFAALVGQYADSFAPAEIIGRCSAVIDYKLHDRDCDLDNLLGLGKDNVYDSYFQSNEAVNYLSLKVSDFACDLASIYAGDGHVLRVLDINAKNDIVLESLESFIADSRVHYYLVLKDGEHKSTVASRFEHLRCLHFVTLDDLDLLENESFDLLVSTGALCQSSFAKNFESIAAKLKNNAFVAGFDLNESLYNGFIFTMLSFADRFKDLRLQNDIAKSCFNNVSESLVFNYLAAATAGHYNFYINSVKRECPQTQSNTQKYDDENLKAFVQSLSIIKDKNAPCVLESLIHTPDAADTDEADKISEKHKVRVLELKSLSDACSDIYTQRQTLKDLSQRHVVFDLCSLDNIKDKESLALLCDQISKTVQSFEGNDTIKSISFMLPYCLMCFASKTHDVADISKSTFEVYTKEAIAYALLNFIRTLRNELSLDIKVISLKDDSTSVTHALTTLSLYESSKIKESVNEVFIDGNRRYGTDFIYRDSTDRAHVSKDDNISYMLDFKQQGSLKSLSFVSSSIGEIADDEVLIENRSVGLNYRDVMWALGLLPAEALENGYSGQSLGLECAGTVVKKGRLVEDLELNDRVMAFTRHCFATHVKAKRESVFKIPDAMSFNDAASVPVAFLTAYYSIVTKAQALKGESILIHGAAGGVGLAAVQIARDLGLEIYATAGTVHKRALLKRLGVEHIYDSRTLDFAEQILNDTDGRGIDIVLNSLYKDGALASLRLLKPFGRFVELGKRDFFENNPLNLKIFKDNLSFLGVDVDELLVYKKPLAIKLLNEIIAKFEDGSYYPLFRSVYTASQVKKAFLDMKASMHIGKIVVDFAFFMKNDRQHVTACENRCDHKQSGSRYLFEKSLADGGCYLITGGMGGLGLALASYLIKNGAGHIYLTGRKSEDESIKAKLESLKENSADKSLCLVDYVSLDVTDYQSVFAFASQLKESGVKINGFYHAAVVLHDAYLKDLEIKDYELLLNTKADGAYHMLKAFSSAAIPFDYTVLFSSITTVFGNEGQANYVLANALIEAYAAKLRAQGHNVMSFLLGPVGDVGLLKGNDKLLNIFESKLGLAALKADDVICHMHNATDISHNNAICSVASESIGSLGCIKESRFDALCGRYVISSQSSGGSLADTILNSPVEQATEILTARIKELIASQLGIDSDKIDTALNLIDLGIDSLSLMEIMAVLERELKIKTSVASLTGRSSIEGIALYCVNRIKGSEGDESIVSDLQKQHGIKSQREYTD